MSDQSQKQILDFSIEASIFVLILTVYVMLSYLIELKNIKFLHESTVAIIMGILSSLFCKYVLNTTISFSNEIFFAIILPPIIFSAGFSLRKSMFFQNIGLICFFGIIGTIIGFILITLILVLLDHLFFKSLNLAQMMIIGSVLCATDTVSAMTLIKRDKFPTLSAVLFGQGIINDAVAIILFRAVSAFASTKDQQFGMEHVLKMTLSFLYLFFFSMFLGIVSGLLLSYLFRRFSFFARHPIKQTSIILLNGYFIYLLGQIFSLSGIITLFTQSIIIGHYAFMNLSEQSKKATGMAFQTVSYIAEAFVFAYLGASLLSISQNLTAVFMGLCLLLFLPFVRAIMVYILPCFYKICKAKFYLNPKQLKICWFSGMIRGVIAFALCLQIQTPNKQFITSLVLIIVILTTIGGSSFMNKYIEIIKLQKTVVIEQLQHLNDNGFNTEGNNKQESLQHNIDRQQKQQSVKKSSFFMLRLKFLQKKYMKPFFGKKSQMNFDQGNKNVDKLSDYGQKDRVKQKQQFIKNSTNSDTNKNIQLQDANEPNQDKQTKIPELLSLLKQTVSTY